MKINIKERKISIIIAVYNTEKYLRKCLDSVTNQNYKNYDILIVNDGSTDSSLSIIKEYQNKNNNIIFIDQKNMGPSIARNNAIKKINSEYFLIVDSDDYISLDTLKILNENITKDLEILRFQLVDVVDDKEIHKKFISFDTMDGKKAIRPLIDSYYTDPACGYLYSTRFFKRNNFKFMEHRYYEDYGIIPYVIIKSTKVKAIRDELYYYVRRKGSITIDSDKEKRNYDDVKIQYFNLLSLLEKENFDNKNYLISFLTNNLIDKLVLLKKDIYKKELIDLKNKKVFNNLLSDTLFRKCKNLLLKFSPKLYYNLIKYILKKD